MKKYKNLTMAVLTMLIVSMLSMSFALPVTAAEKTAEPVKVPKQVLIIPFKDGGCSINIFSYMNIKSPYVPKGYGWTELKSYTNIKASNSEKEFLFDYSSAETIINYFHDDIYVSINETGILPDITPYVVIDRKTGQVIANPAFNKSDDFTISLAELKKHFNIECQVMGNYYFLTVSKPYELPKD